MQASIALLTRLLLSAFIILAARSAWAFDSVLLSKHLTPADTKTFQPVGLAIAPEGTLWIANEGTHQLLRVNAAGEFVAPIGQAGSGMGQFQSPHALAIDGEGLIYVADSGNHRIQVLSPDGSPKRSFGERGNGLGQLKEPWWVTVSVDGVLAVADRDESRVQLFSKDGIFLNVFDTGMPVDGLAFDVAGRLYTSHTKNHLVAQWSTAGQQLKTFTGIEPSVKGFSKPGTLTVADGLLYVADADSRSWREMNLKGRTLGTFGRSGSGDGQFKSLEAIAVRDHVVFIADPKNHRIAVLSVQRGQPLPVTTPAPASRLQVERTQVLALEADRLAAAPDGGIYGLSMAKGVMAHWNAEGDALGSLDLKTTLSVRSPSGLAIAPASGNLFIADQGGDQVLKIDPSGKLLTTFGKGGSFFKGADGELSDPQGMSCSAQGVLYIADTGNARLQVFNHQGLFQFSAGGRGVGPGQLKSPVDVVLDKDRLYVVDPGLKKIVAFNSTGRFLFETGTVGPEPLVDPRQAVLDREGNFFVLDAGRSRILAFDPQGAYLGGFGASGKAPGFLNRPRAMALAANGELLIAEEGRVQRFRIQVLPPAPLEVSARPGEGFVALTWQPVKTRYPALYAIFRSSGTSLPVLLKETVETAFSDDTLSPGTTFTYTVAAKSVQGAMSVPSVPVQAMALAISGPRLEILAATIEDVFSAHYKYYGRSPLGRVTIRNNGEAPVQKGKVSFAIQGYMDYPTETPLNGLRSGEEKIVPLLATFNNRILEVTETTPIQAQVKMSFYNGDQERETVRYLPFKLYSRNTIRWDTKDRLAAFVTPNDPSVIDFARGVVTPFADAHRGAPVPSAVVTAWALFEGLGTYGISYVPRPNNPYDRVSLDSSTVDSVQFARETLARKSGDCADVTVLLSSMLESMTVTTVALDAPGHLFLMFDTGEERKEALGFPDDWVVSYAGTWWIPIEATSLGSPFMEAWKQGAEQYRRYSAQGKLGYIDIHQAWRTFEPATLPETGSGVKAPERQAIEDKFISDWKALVDARWQSSLSRIRKNYGESTGASFLNRGLLAVEYRRYDDAAELFQKAAQSPDQASAALNNLGNLAMVKGDAAAAETYYKQALHKDPSDARLQINLARAYLKLSRAKAAGDAYQAALRADPTLREEFPDLGSLAP